MIYEPKYKIGQKVYYLANYLRANHLEIMPVKIIGIRIAETLEKEPKTYYQYEIEKLNEPNWDLRRICILPNECDLFANKQELKQALNKLCDRLSKAKELSDY